MRLKGFFRSKKKDIPEGPPEKWSNEAWLTLLADSKSSDGIQALRREMVSSLRFGLRSQSSKVSHDDIEDFAQEALIRILSNLDSFRGDSRFLTWATKIALRVSFSNLRLKKWQDVSLHAAADSQSVVDSIPDLAPSPEESTSRAMMVEMLFKVMREELGSKQYQAMVAVAINGLPMEVVARQMDMNRNALYKLLHDARKKLKKALEDRRIEVDEFLNDS